MGDTTYKAKIHPINNTPHKERHLFAHHMKSKMNQIRYKIALAPQTTRKSTPQITTEPTKTSHKNDIITVPIYLIPNTLSHKASCLFANNVKN